jgi:hypothetical protein
MLIDYFLSFANWTCFSFWQVNSSGTRRLLIDDQIEKLLHLFVEWVRRNLSFKIFFDYYCENRPNENCKLSGKRREVGANMEQIENGPFHFAPIIFRMLSALPCLPVPFWLRNAISSPSIQELNKRNPTIELSIMNNMWRWNKTWPVLGQKVLIWQCVTPCPMVRVGLIITKLKLFSVTIICGARREGNLKSRI